MNELMFDPQNEPKGDYRIGIHFHFYFHWKDWQLWLGKHSGLIGLGLGPLQLILTWHREYSRKQCEDALKRDLQEQETILNRGSAEDPGESI